MFLISHGKKSNLVPPTHLDDLFKSIGSTVYNNKKRFLAFQSILYDNDFSEYIKTMFKVQESNNHMAKNILNIMNVIGILFMNIDSLRTKEWDHFLSSIRLMTTWMMVYDNTN